LGVIEKLATSLGRRDEVPNQELASLIVAKNDRKGIAELVKNLANKDSGIQVDCVKVLYEIGEKKPELISSYAGEFVSLLANKNNRLSWGAMTALDGITLQRPDIIYAALPRLREIADGGSVIARDHFVNILIKLSSVPEFQDNATDLLIDQLRRAPPNQLRMYAERAFPIINEKNKSRFQKVLRSRADSLTPESKRKRVENVLKKLS
jgi:hypothetical protein